MSLGDDASRVGEYCTGMQSTTVIYLLFVSVEVPILTNNAPTPEIYVFVNIVSLSL